MLVDLSERSTKSELMDDFKGGPERLREVYNDINRANRILGGNRLTVNAVARLAKASPQESYVIVDVGCGDGNMLRKVADYCRKRNIKTRLIGIELNGEALQLAETASIEYDEIHYLKEDVLKLKVSDLNCDIVINTLTMHHFGNADLLLFLKKFTQLARIGVVINDLHRSRRAYYLYKLFRLVFIKTRTARVDGLISISRGFVRSELIDQSKRLTHVDHHIQWKWAFRYIWVMRPNRI